MSTRLFLLKLAATLAALIAGGCIAPIPSPSEDVEPKPPIEDISQLEPSTIAVSMSSDDFANVVRWFGESNSVTLHEPLKVSHDKVSLDFPANTCAHYTTNDAEVVITFDKPYPIVKAGLAKLIGGVSLKAVKINADGSGVAGTKLGNFSFRWNEEVAGTADLPEVLLYMTTGCPACEVAKRELEKATDLPFKVIVKDTAPSWVKTYPTLHWQVSGDDWRYRAGWDGVPKFVEIWKKSREPKQYQRTKTSADARTFVRPDPSSIGSRSVAKWSINGDFTPSRSVLLSHLTNDGIHRGRHDRAWLESLTTEQLRYVHDVDHGD